MPLKKWWTTVRDSLWFLPAIWVVVSAGLAFAMITIDRRTPEFAANFPLVFGGGADGARGLLSSIAGSMITVAGVTFSITIVALQLASSQLSPRVLRNFMRDRRSQIVLGAFIGAFTYTILVLRSIRVELDGVDAFVPSVAVSVGILFALLALGMFVFFIHHIANRIQLGTIVANIAEETTDQVEQDWPEEDENGAPPRIPSEPPGVVTATDSGYLQLVDMEELTEIATRDRLLVRLEVRPGAWVQEGAPLYSVWPSSAANDKLTEILNAQVSLGPQRSIEQDAAFGVRQLVDVALKAISPGINDPTSASDCINRLGQILSAVGNRFPPRWTHRDAEHAERLLIPAADWDELVGLAFDQLRQYSAGSADVSISTVDTLRTVAQAVPANRHPALARQVRLVGESAGTIDLVADRQRVEDAVRRALDVMRA